MNRCVGMNGMRADQSPADFTAVYSYRSCDLRRTSNCTSKTFNCRAVFCKNKVTSRSAATKVFLLEPFAEIFLGVHIDAVPHNRIRFDCVAFGGVFELFSYRQLGTDFFSLTRSHIAQLNIICFVAPCLLYLDRRSIVSWLGVDQGGESCYL